MPFCSKCGNQINQGNAFCAKCGNKVAQAPNAGAQQTNQQANQQTSQPMNDGGAQQNSEVMMVLGADKKEGMLKRLTGYLVFTPRRVIHAVVDNKTVKVEMDKMRADMKAQGVGFFKQTAQLANFWNVYGQKYYKMPLEAILREEPRNTEFAMDHISRFTFRSSTTSGDGQGNSQEHPGNMIIEMGGNKFKFSHQYKDYNKNIRNVLNNLFGGRLKYKGSRGLTINIGGKGNTDGFE